MKRITVKNVFLLQLLLAMFLHQSVNTGDCQEQKVIKAYSENFRTIISGDARPRVAYDGVNSEPGIAFTEGPSWINGTLYFSSCYYLSKRGKEGLHILKPDGAVELLNNKIRTEGTMPLPNGNLAVCDLGNSSIIEMTMQGDLVRTLADSCDGLPLGVPNDLITDKKGGIYFTQPNANKLPGNAVYYINPEGNVIRVTGWDELDAPNGCLLNPDNSKFFLGDYQKPTIWVFDVNEDGTLSGKRPFAQVLIGNSPVIKDKIPISRADGMTFDRSGNLYVATSLGIQVFDSSGGLLGIIGFPELTSHLVFGGEDMSTLYVTCKEHIFAIQTKMKGYRYPIE